MMAADATFTRDGLTGRIPEGDAEDMAALRDSYAHLCKLRDEVIAAGLLPPLEQWRGVNPHL
jgi:malate dehydrogenase